MGRNSVSDKKEFVQWLRNHNGHLTTIGEHIRHRLESVKEKNEVLSTKVQESYPQSSNSLSPFNSTFLVTQQLAHTTMQACDQHIKTQLEQIRKGNQTIESRMKEEAMRSRESLYKILNKDEVGLKPYHEVETATEELKQVIADVVKECEAVKQKSSAVNGNIKEEYSGITQDIKNLETINKELCLEITTFRSNLNEKLFSLNLKSSNSANMESSEIVELLKDISDMETKLAHYSKYI